MITTIIEAVMRMAILVPMVLLLLFALYEYLRPKLPYEVRPKLPKLPMVGAKEGEWFARSRAMYRNSIDVLTAVEAAYKFKDQACLLPIIDFGSMVIVPPGEIDWLLDQPESDLSTHMHHQDAFQLDWTLTDPKIVEDTNPIHQVLISRKLTREINHLLPGLAEEIDGSISETWGTDTEDFKELCLMDDMPLALSRVVSRIFVGAPLCRNMVLTRNAIAFGRGLGFTAILMRCTPPALRPLLAPLLSLPGRIATWQYFGIVRHELNRRIKEMYAKGTARGFRLAAAKYNDFLQWTLEAAIESGDPYMMNPNTIMGRVLFLNFPSTHTSSFALTHVLLDLAASDPADIEELRTEITTALNAHGGEFNKQALMDMPKLDSVFRESQRIHPAATVASPKLVANRQGVTMPSGTHLEYGTYVATLMYPILHDPALYPEPETFRPFRFAELREEAHAKGKKLEKARQAWTAVTKKYPAFGLGRHACPGRFFAAASMKATLAYIVTHYDIEKLPARPIDPTFGVALLPPLKARIRFKRRKEPLWKVGQVRNDTLV